MTTYADLELRIRRMLGDLDASDYSDELIYDAVCAGLDATLPWFANRKTQVLTGDGSSLSFALETDLYEIDGVQLADTGELLPLASLAPGVFQGTNSAGQDWIEYPTGYIMLSQKLGSDETASIFYRAYWDKPEDHTDDDFELTIPGFLEKGVVYYSVAYCIIPDAIDASDIAQWKTRADSGDPEDNPLEKTVRFMLSLFEAEMNRHPMQIAGSRA